MDPFQKKHINNTEEFKDCLRKYRKTYDIESFDEFYQVFKARNFEPLTSIQKSYRKRNNSASSNQQVVTKKLLTYYSNKYPLLKVQKVLFHSDSKSPKANNNNNNTDMNNIQRQSLEKNSLAYPSPTNGLQSLDLGERKLKLNKLPVMKLDKSIVNKSDDGFEDFIKKNEKLMKNNNYMINASKNIGQKVNETENVSLEMDSINLTPKNKLTTSFKKKLPMIYNTVSSRIYETHDTRTTKATSHENQTKFSRRNSSLHIDTLTVADTINKSISINTNNNNNNNTNKMSELYKPNKLIDRYAELYQKFKDPEMRKSNWKNRLNQSDLTPLAGPFHKISELDTELQQSPKQLIPNNNKISSNKKTRNNKIKNNNNNHAEHHNPYNELTFENIKKEFEKRIKIEANNKIDFNPKRLDQKIEKFYDKLNRNYDYLERRVYKTLPRKYDMEDYLKTLYGKDVTIKDHIRMKIKMIDQAKLDPDLRELLRNVNIDD